MFVLSMSRERISEYDDLVTEASPHHLRSKGDLYIAFSLRSHFYSRVSSSCEVKKVCLNNEQLRNHRKLNQWKFFTNNCCRTRNATFFHGESRGHSTTTGLLLKSESCWIGMKPCDFALANEDHEGRK